MSKPRPTPQSDDAAKAVLGEFVEWFDRTFPRDGKNLPGITLYGIYERARNALAPNPQEAGDSDDAGQTCDPDEMPQWIELDADELQKGALMSRRFKPLPTDPSPTEAAKE